MTVETSIFAALEAIGPAGGVWPNVSPDDNLVWPKIIYSRISGVPVRHMAGGTPPVSELRLQIDVYAPKYADAKAMAESVKAAMVTLQATVPNDLENDTDIYEEVVELNRVLLEYWIFG